MLSSVTHGFPFQVIRRLPAVQHHLDQMQLAVLEDRKTVQAAEERNGFRGKRPIGWGKPAVKIFGVEVDKQGGILICITVLAR